MVILFLDFDGVLHPVGGVQSGERFSRLPMLEALLRETAFRDVHIVISSTWREAFPMARLAEAFAADLRPRILGGTPVLDDYDGDHARYAEIRAWLDAHPDVISWVALDDGIGAFPTHQRKNAVFTDPQIGLNEESLARLRKMLEGFSA